MSPSSPKPTAIVTGFGPFGFTHRVNSSWEAVQSLMELQTENVCLVTEQIPVEYRTVRTALDRLLNDYNPELVVHVGVSTKVNCVTLEKLAYNEPYKKFDAAGCAPPSVSCIDNGPDCLASLIDLKDVCAEINKCCNMQTSLSADPGRYLCGYLYYYSLYHTKCSTVFIHVPPLNKPYSAQQLALALKTVIDVLLGQRSGDQE